MAWMAVSMINGFSERHHDRTRSSRRGAGRIHPRRCASRMFHPLPGGRLAALDPVKGKRLMRREAKAFIQRDR